MQKIYQGHPHHCFRPSAALGLPRQNEIGVLAFSKALSRAYNEGVAEHFVMAMEPLPNLSEQRSHW
jgi:hypothetical protein